MEEKKLLTRPDDDLDCNHFESFLCDDFLISRVTPDGLQGKIWFDLQIEGLSLEANDFKFALYDVNALTHII